MTTYYFIDLGDGSLNIRRNMDNKCDEHVLYTDKFRDAEGASKVKEALIAGGILEVKDND